MRSCLNSLVGLFLQMYTPCLGFHWLLWMVKETSRRGDGSEILCSLEAVLGVREKQCWVVGELQPNSGGAREASPVIFSRCSICVPNWNIHDSLPPASALFLDASVCSLGVYPPPKLCMAHRARLGTVATLQAQLPAGWSLASLNPAEVSSLLFPAPAGWVEHTHGAKLSLCLSV